MKVLVFVGLLALCAAQQQDGPTAAAVGKIKYSPQDKFLAHDNVGNFACRIDQVEVTMDVPGDEDKTVLSAEDLEGALSQTATIEWAHVNQFFFAGLDGRNDEKNLGAAGGDLGEFIMGLEAYTKETGVQLTAEEVDALLSRYLKVMSREKFYYATDEKAYRKLAIATGCQNLKIAEIGDKRKRAAILEKFAAPEAAEYVGDTYIKFLFNNHEALGINRDYISFALQAFHANLWRNTPEADKLCYTMLHGRSDPHALIHVKTPGYCIDQGLAPLISSQLCSGQVFIEHTDAVKLYRRELVQLIAKEGDNPQNILAQFNTVAQQNLANFWDGFSGLPTFTVTFSHSTPFLEETK